MPYPRSFLKLLLAAFTLVALPLIVALITSAIAVEQIASRSATAVYQAVQATQSSRRLSELLTAMERNARQIVILGDRALLDAYRINREQFLQTAAQFEGLPFDAAQRADLAAIITAEQQIFDALSDRALKPASLQAQVSKFIELSSRAQAIAAKSGELIDHEVETMRKTAADARRVMLWQGLALVPVVIFLVAGFTVLISRPIRQIDAAIRNLGTGNFNAPVVVGGPEDLERLGQRIDWMRRQLLDLERDKNRFLQQIAHELKTPLTALREGVQLLSDDVVGTLTPEQSEIARILRHSGIELQRRIEDLLSYGAIQFQKLRLDLAPVSPRQVLERIAQDQRLALQAKNLVLQKSSSDIVLMADPDKVRVVLDNLLSNAIKYSPDGGTITADIHPEDASLIIDMVDQGPGIAAADLPHIFEPFYQGRVEASGPVKGTGLGLSIVKEYVTAHGGSIAVLARPQEGGAHFRVRLPLEHSTAP